MLWTAAFPKGVCCLWDGHLAKGCSSVEFFPSNKLYSQEFYLPVAHSIWLLLSSGRAYFTQLSMWKWQGWSMMDLTPLIHMLQYFFVFLIWVGGGGCFWRVFLVNCLIFLRQIPSGPDVSSALWHSKKFYNYFWHYLNFWLFLLSSQNCMAVLGIFSTFPIPYKHCTFYPRLLLLCIICLSTLQKSCPLKHAMFSAICNSSLSEGAVVLSASTCCFAHQRPVHFWFLSPFGSFCSPQVVCMGFWSQTAFQHTEKE